VLDKSSSRFVTKPLHELARIGSFNVMAVNPSQLAHGIWKAEPKKAIISYAGKKAVKKLKTEDGRQVSGSDEHRLYMRRGKKIMKLRISEIEIGDELVCLPR